MPCFQTLTSSLFTFLHLHVIMVATMMRIWRPFAFWMTCGGLPGCSQAGVLSISDKFETRSSSPERWNVRLCSLGRETRTKNLESSVPQAKPLSSGCDWLKQLHRTYAFMCRRCWWNGELTSRSSCHRIRLEHINLCRAPSHSPPKDMVVLAEMRVQP